jgi:uroporphyrinogen-III synthase
MPNGLSGALVVCLESRRSREMAKLVEKQGGRALSAPSMKEVPLLEQRDALAFASVLERQECDALVLLTGVGAKMLFDVLRAELGANRALERLKALSIYCRGPKPLAVCRELGVTPAGVAPEPNTSNELLPLLRAANLQGKRVSVQEYGQSSPELLDALREQGAQVTSIPVYAWTLPDDLEPLELAVKAICNDEADAITFTSGQQLEHLVSIAGKLCLAQLLVQRLQENVVVASIGPVTSEGLARHGIRPDLTPEHPKMGQLVSELAGAWPSLKEKRTRASSLQSKR